MILFSDFDNALFFRNDAQKTDSNISAIKAWRNAHNQFCIITGRSYKSLVGCFPGVEEICDYYVVDSGSIILSKSGDFLRGFYFEPTIVEGIVNFSKGFPEVPAAFYYTPDSEGIDYRTKNVTKLRLWFKDTSLIRSIAEQIRESFPVFAFESGVAMPSHKDLAGRKEFIEIIPIGFGKSNAVNFLQQEKGIPSKDIITVGDGLNDYEMIRDFDGFAIEGSELANAHEELKVVNSVSALVKLFN